MYVSHSAVSESFATPRTIDHQAPLFMGFPRQEYWSGLPFPFPGDLPGPGIKPRSSALQADSLPSEPPGKPKTLYTIQQNIDQLVHRLRLYVNQRYSEESKETNCKQGQDICNTFY